MKTDDLIKALAADAKSVEPPIARTLAVAVGAGALLSLVLFLAMFGPRPDFTEVASSSVRFVFKFVVTLSLAIPAFLLVRGLSRPDIGLLKNYTTIAASLPGSDPNDPRYVREAFAAGASGYVLKEAADAEVVAAVREAARGGRYVNPELGARLVAANAEAERRAEEDPLTEREREVLRLLALGHTNQEIASQLYISVRTAETHRAHVMQKLRFTTRAELVRYALAQGLLE